MLEIVRLTKIECLFNAENELYAVLGSKTPSGSIKDVTVYQMLQSYKKDGLLIDGGTIIEATSGNTGIALSYYQKEFNYHCIIVMPSSMSQQRRDMISKYGAELVLVDGGMSECDAKAQELSNSIENAFLFKQFESKHNPNAHYVFTAPYIDENIKDINFLVAGIGTGGTISGCSKYFKEKYDGFKAIGVEPKESPLLTKGVAGPHLIQGIGANFIPGTYLADYVDEIVDVEGRESIEMAKTIRKIEEIDIGISSGAALLGTLSYIKQNNLKNKKIVVIFPDKGDRYTW